MDSIKVWVSFVLAACEDKTRATSLTFALDNEIDGVSYTRETCSWPRRDV